MRTAWALLGLLGCSDYGLQDHVKPTTTDVAALSVTPGSIDEVGLCSPASHELSVQNEGEGALTVSELRIEGEGWVLTSAPTLPLTLSGGESTRVVVEGTEGKAELVVVSDDPEVPELRVPLSAAANQPPTVTITTPSGGDIFGEGVDVTLEGTVTDPEDAAETLSATWSSSVDGTLTTRSPGADGAVDWLWAAAARSSGPATVSLAATDSCGATTVATADACQDGANTYDALSLSAWHYEGSAAWDSGAANLLLTPATTDQVGTAFETSSPVNADNVDIDFYVYLGGGTGADGMSLTALDVARATTFLGGSGCGIGYGGSADCTAGPALPGWTLEIDTYYNGGVDPTADDHLAFTFDGDVDGYQAWAALPEMEDTGWHYVEVSIVAPHVRVAVDSVVYLDQDIPGNYAFSAYVGFTAGTGGETNEHRVDELSVTDYSCD